MKQYYKDEYIKLIQGDCLEVMDKMIEKGIKVDLILTDPPYGTTACKWDSIIPLDKMWEKLNKLSNTYILFSSEPFSSLLRCSNLKQFKYDWIWKKNKPQGFLNAKKMPLKDYENISVFAKSNIIYNPQGLIKIDKIVKNTGTKNKTSNKSNGDKTSANNAIKNEFYKQEYTNYPTQIIEFKNSGNKQVHPTQKPLDLMEYLINTYTKENDLILDFTCGSGTTLVAAKNLKRRCIGIELEEKYCEIAKNRIEQQI